MKRVAAYVLAIILLPIALLLHVALAAFEAWHFGPSQWILRCLKWMNYKAFKPVATWILKSLKESQQQKKEV